MFQKTLEVERKILGVTLDDIEKRVEKIGGIPEFTREKFHGIWVENSQGIRFRIRSEGKNGVRSERKFHEISGYKSEIGIHIKSSFDETIAFVKTIGFQIVSETVKLRTQWILNYKNREVRVLVDEFESLRGLKNVPSIAEIEVIVPPQEVEMGEKIIFEVGTLLGFNKKEIVKIGESKLFEMYNKTQIGQMN